MVRSAGGSHSSGFVPGFDKTTLAASASRKRSRATSFALALGSKTRSSSLVVSLAPMTGSSLPPAIEAMAAAANVFVEEPSGAVSLMLDAPSSKRSKLAQGEEPSEGAPPLDVFQDLLVKAATQPGEARARP